ncbi:Cochaperone protein [Thecaphora frezii]
MSNPTAIPAKPRFDFYQTDTSVTVSVFVKGASEQDVSVDIGDRSLSVKVKLPAAGSETALVIDPLYSAVNKVASSYKLFSTKIDIVLNKAHPGVQWKKLEADSSNINAATTPAYTAVATNVVASSSAPSSSTSAASAQPRRSKWDTLQLDDDDATEGADAEADINKFFQKLYADADEDTKRAMLKSYQESGGTTLSTDWSKVGQSKVETRPPEGMIAKRWDE